MPTVVAGEPYQFANLSPANDVRGSATAKPNIDEIRSHDRTARRNFGRGDSASIQHQQPTTVPASKGGAVGRERGADVVDHAYLVDGVLVFERDIHMIAADELYPKHDGCHVDQCMRGRPAPVSKSTGGHAWPNNAGTGNTGHTGRTFWA
jgi:hypothetical protein